MNKKNFILATFGSMVALMAVSISSFSAVKGNALRVSADNNEDIIVSNFDLKAKAPTYGAEWDTYAGWGQFDANSVTLSEDTITSSEFGDTSSAYTWEITKASGDKGGICRYGYNIGIYNAKIVIQLNDYSRYIKAISLPLAATNGYNNNTINLYTSRDASGTAVSSVNPAGTLSLSGNADESINVVSFVDNPNDTKSCYGYTTFSYTLGYVTSAEQQAKFFSEAFLREMTCDGVDSITNDVWDTFKTRISTMSSDALLILKDADANKDSESIIEQAMARYDLIANKYSKNNFLNRDSVVSSGLFNGFDISSENNSFILIIIVGATVAITTFGSLLILKKKKHK